MMWKGHTIFIIKIRPTPLLLKMYVITKNYDYRISMRYGVERRIIDRCLPTQTNSPSCLGDSIYTNYANEALVRFRRGGDHELLEAVKTVPASRKYTLGSSRRRVEDRLLYSMTLP